MLVVYSLIILVRIKVIVVFFYLSFVKVVNNVVVEHFFQLSLSCRTIFPLARKNWIISPLKQGKTSKITILMHARLCSQSCKNETNLSSIFWLRWKPYSFGSGLACFPTLCDRKRARTGLEHSLRKHITYYKTLRSQVHVLHLAQSVTWYGIWISNWLASSLFSYVVFNQEKPLVPRVGPMWILVNSVLPQGHLLF